MKTKLAYITASIVAFQLAGLQAATISFVGSQLNMEAKTSDIGTGWRNAGSPAKPLDADGNDVLGTDGYRLFATAISSLPTYVSSITNGAVGTFTGAAYAVIDDPTNTANADVQTGTLFVNGAAVAAETDMFSFTLQGTVPATFRIALMVDNTDNPSTIDGTQFRVRQTTGGAGDSGAQSFLATNTSPDWYFLSITGGVAGDVFTMSEINPTAATKNFQVGAIAFDSVPEPSTILFLVGGVGMFALMRRRRA